MPPEIMSVCSKQLRLMLPYFSDKTGKGAVFFSKTTIRCGDTLNAVFWRVASAREWIHTRRYKAEPQ